MPLAFPALHDNSGMTTSTHAKELRRMAMQALVERDPDRKVNLTRELHVQASALSIVSSTQIPEPGGVPGHPAKPELRSHLDVPKRSPFTAEGLAALLHSVTHIKFNAIKTIFKSVFHRVKCLTA
jgi:uncharacterized ferritin-like protein (DUF455 family)